MLFGIAEKLPTFARLRMANSRMKHYLDLSVVLARETPFVDLLARIAKATFERRGTTVPTTFAVALNGAFARGASRQELWRAFFKMDELATEPLIATVDRWRAALESALKRAVQ